MPVVLAPDDQRLTWQGAVSLHRTPDWVMPWRIPYVDRLLFPPLEPRERRSMPTGLPPQFESDSTLLTHVANPTGVPIAFRSDTRTVAGDVELNPSSAPIDVCCDRALLGTAPLSGQAEFRFGQLPAGDKLIEQWMPHWGPFGLRSIELDDGATVAPFKGTRPRWTTYGSSISEHPEARSPAHSWPAVVARACDVNLTYLGFAGECHLEPMVARIIRGLPSDYIPLSVGINIYGNASLNVRTYRPAIIGTVRTIRERHPDVPIALISPIFCPDAKTSPNAVGFDLRTIRAETGQAVEALQAHGDAARRHLRQAPGVRPAHPGLAHPELLLQQRGART